MGIAVVSVRHLAKETACYAITPDTLSRWPCRGLHNFGGVRIRCELDSEASQPFIFTAAVGFSLRTLVHVRGQRETVRRGSITGPHI